MENKIAHTSKTIGTRIPILFLSTKIKEHTGFYLQKNEICWCLTTLTVISNVMTFIVSKALFQDAFDFFIVLLFHYITKSSFLL